MRLKAGKKDLPNDPEVAAIDNTTLDSVAIVAQILQELAVAQQPLGVTQLARRLNQSKSRIYRYLVSLKQLGFVEQDSETERYGLGWKLFQLGEAASHQFDLRRLAAPYLKRLRDLAGLTALLAVPINGVAMVIATAEADRDVSITVKPGNRPSPHGSAQGRIVLAFSDDQVQNRILKRKGSAIAQYPGKEPESLRRRLNRILERLYEEAPNEVLIGINALAAPIFRDGNELVGVIGLVGSVQDIPSPAISKQIEWVRGCGAAISETLNATLYQKHGIAVPDEFRRLISNAEEI